MSLKAKIITKLKAYAKEKGYNLSNVRINTLSDRLDGILDKEDDIDEGITNMDALVDFKELATLDDAKRNADKKTAEDADKTKTKDEPEKKADEDTSDKDKDKDETPAWMKAYIEKQDQQMTALQTELANIKKGNTTQSRRSQLEAKLKDAPEKFKARALRDFDRLKLDTDEDFTNYLADIEQDVADEIQAQSDAGLGGDAPTRGLGGGGKLKEEEVSSEMKELIADRKAEAEAKASVSA